jgi:hypothetical protein
MKRETKRSAKVLRLMERFGVKSIGKDLCGHFAPEDAIDIIKTAESRDRKPGQVVVASVQLALPEVKKLKAIALEARGNHRSAETETLMTEYNIPNKGKTMCGFFTPEVAVEVLELAEKHCIPVSQIVRVCMAIGLPLFKKAYPAIRKAHA